VASCQSRHRHYHCHTEPGCSTPAAAIPMDLHVPSDRGFMSLDATALPFSGRASGDEPSDQAPSLRQLPCPPTLILNLSCRPSRVLSHHSPSSSSPLVVISTQSQCQQSSGQVGELTDGARQGICVDLVAMKRPSAPHSASLHLAPSTMQHF